MGLIKAGIGALGGTLADQWRDFLTVPVDIAPTAALFPAVPVGTNAGRGSSTKASTGIVTNGSKIVVPEGYGLLLFQEGELTAFANEPEDVPRAVDFRRRSRCDGQALRTIAPSLLEVRVASA